MTHFDEFPRDTSAENAIIGAVLVDPDCIDRLFELSVYDFFDAENRKIFAAMLRMREDREPIDEITLHAALRCDNVSVASLIERSTQTVTAANVEHYAAMVKTASAVERMRRALIAGAKLCEPGAGIEAIAQAQDMVNLAANQRKQTGLVNAAIPVREYVKALMSDEPEDRGISTGFRALDKQIVGLKRGDMITIAARPGMGKTVIGANIALNAAMNGHTVAMFSLEMSEQAMAMRLTASIGHVSGKRLQNKETMGYGDWSNASAVVDKIASKRLLIDSTCGLSIYEMMARARHQKANGGLDLIVIDYLQKMRGSDQGKFPNREREVSEISNGMKTIAKELNIPVVALAQINRMVEARSEKRPMLSELRESGSVEQDSDIVMMLYRDEYYNPETLDRGVVEVDVVKNRNGETGIVKLKAVMEQFRFEDL